MVYGELIIRISRHSFYMPQPIGSLYLRHCTCCPTTVPSSPTGPAAPLQEISTVSSSPHFTAAAAAAASQGAQPPAAVQSEFRPARPEDLHIKGFVHEVRYIAVVC